MWRWSARRPPLEEFARMAALARSLVRRSSWCALVVGLASLILAPAPVAAQFVSTSSIDGTVTDESGAAMPGVTVTLTSPALQVPQLAMVTNSEGRYRFTQLPAGTFQARFELA